MGQVWSTAQPREDRLFQFVLAGDIEGIRDLCRRRTNLECIDREGNTPLIVACKDSALLNVAVALIELRANVNAYGPAGRRGGTPLHHAAGRGLEATVRLLLFSGANALLRNDDGQTALDFARIHRNVGVVRAIEDHICLFSGWLREFYGPGCLKAFAPRLLSSKVWAVVLPSSSSMNHLRLQLAVYTNKQESQACTIIPLSEGDIKEPKFDQPDPEMTVFDQSSNIGYHFASSTQGDKHQLRLLYDACRGIIQVGPMARHQHLQHDIPDSNGHENPSEEQVQMGTTLIGFIQSAIENTQQQLPSNRDGAIDTNESPSTDLDFSDDDGTAASSSSSSSASCCICLDAPVQGACVPCGHMAGCMACLSKIEGNCPVCRASTTQVIRLYEV